MPDEIPKRVVDAATVLAFVFAALPYLISPDATNQALPRFIKRFRGWIAFVAFVTFIWLLHKQPFMHAKMPVWGAVDEALGLIALFVSLLSFIARRVARKSKAAQSTAPKQLNELELADPKLPQTELTNANPIPQLRPHLTVPNYVDMAGMRWPITFDKVRREPVCGKCNLKLTRTTTGHYSPMMWKCNGCNTNYEWDHRSKGDPQDAAAEIINS